MHRPKAPVPRSPARRRRRPYRTGDAAVDDAIEALVALRADHPHIDLVREMIVTSMKVGSSRVDLQACKLEYSIVSPK